MKKIFLLFVLLIILSLISFGCAVAPDDTNDNNQETPDAGGAIEDENPVDLTDKQTMEGTFTGWIDNNSFEVIANDVPYAIRTNEDVTMPDDELDGKNVRVTYVVNDQGQNILQLIEVLD